MTFKTVAYKPQKLLKCIIHTTFFLKEAYKPQKLVICMIEATFLQRINICHNFSLKVLYKPLYFKRMHINQLQIGGDRKIIKIIKKIQLNA